VNPSIARTAVIFAQYPLWLDALQIVLDRLDLVVVGRAYRQQDAIRMLEEHAPDVLVADLGTIRDDDGSELLVRARAANPEVKCVVLSENADPAEAERAFGAGAAIFCARRTHPEDLAAAIRQAFDRSIYFASPRWPGPATPAPSAATAEAALTRRELEILRHAAQGASNADIAKRLWVTEQTVKFHLSNSYRKLGVSNRTEAGLWAQRNGLLSDQPAA